MKKKSLPVFFVGLLMCGCQMKEVINEYNVVPLPVTMSEQQGRFYLNSDVPIVVNASQEVERLRKTAEQLSRQERDKPHDREPER